MELEIFTNFDTHFREPFINVDVQYSLQTARGILNTFIYLAHFSNNFNSGSHTKSSRNLIAQ